VQLVLCIITKTFDIPYYVVKLTKASVVVGLLTCTRW